MFKCRLDLGWGDLQTNPAVKVYLLSSSRARRRRGLILSRQLHGKMPRPRIRDERGWFVPAEGTKARTIYDVLVAAEQCEEEFNAVVLARLLGTTVNTVQTTVWRVRTRQIDPAFSKARINRCSSELHNARPHASKPLEGPRRSIGRMVESLCGISIRGLCDGG